MATVPEVLLVNPPFRRKRSLVYMPMGLGYIGTVLKRAGFEVMLHDMNIMGTNPAYVADLVKELSIPIIALTGFISQGAHIISISKAIKARKPDTKIIVGGSMIYGAEGYFSGHDEIDVIVRGEGEDLIIPIMEALLSGKPFPESPGVISRDGARLVDHPGDGYIQDINSLPIIDRDLFEVDRYINGYHAGEKGKRSLEITWSRSCPYSCVYCINSLRIGPYRVRSVDKVIQEIAFLIDRYAVNDIIFASEVFTARKEKVYEFCKRMLEFKITWLIHTRADLLDEDLVIAMKEGGCRQIMIGIESANNDLLEKMNKKITVDQISKAVELIKEHGIGVKGGFIAGLPWETDESLNDSKKFCIRHDLVYWPAFATAYPNTALYEEARHLIKDESDYLESITDHDQFLDLILNMTSFPTKTLVKKHLKCCAETAAEFVHKRLLWLPKKFIILIAYVFLRIYHCDRFLGVDFHSLSHRLATNMYKVITKR